MSFKIFREFHKNLLCPSRTKECDKYFHSPINSLSISNDNRSQTLSWIVIKLLRKALIWHSFDNNHKGIFMCDILLYITSKSYFFLITRLNCKFSFITQVEALFSGWMFFEELLRANFFFSLVPFLKRN